MLSPEAEPGPDEAEQQVVIEFQVENQRGLFVMGYPKFTSSMLTLLDPRPFTLLDGSPLGLSLQNYEVPDDTWAWAWPRWYVDMSADVDDQGWSYSWRFRSSHWQGAHHTMRSFVRQRLWKRPRIKKKVPKAVLEIERQQFLGQSISKDEDMPRIDLMLSPKMTMDLDLRRNQEHQRLDDNHDKPGLLEILKTKRNDRERINAIVHFLATESALPADLVAFKRQILDQLAFPVSHRTLADKLAEKAAAGSTACGSFLLTPPVKWWMRVWNRGEPNVVDVDI